MLGGENMPSVQKKRGLFPSAFNAGGDYREETSVELDIPEQGKKNKARKATKAPKY